MYEKDEKDRNTSGLFVLILLCSLKRRNRAKDKFYHLSIHLLYPWCNFVFYRANFSIYNFLFIIAAFFNTEKIYNSENSLLYVSVIRTGTP